MAKQLNPGDPFPSFTVPLTDGRNSTNRTCREAGLENFPVGTQREVGRVENGAALFPVGADLIGILRDLETVADRKSRAGALDHFFGFVEGIDR